MNGTSAHTLQVGQYTMCFCSEDCKEAFSEDIAQSVLALKPDEAQQH